MMPLGTRSVRLRLPRLLLKPGTVRWSPLGMQKSRQVQRQRPRRLQTTPRRRGKVQLMQQASQRLPNLPQRWLQPRQRSLRQLRAWRLMPRWSWHRLHLTQQQRQPQQRRQLPWLPQHSLSSFLAHWQVLCWRSGAVLSPPTWKGLPWAWQTSQKSMGCARRTLRMYDGSSGRCWSARTRGPHWSASSSRASMPLTWTPAS
mmetsp:Transcript_35241/g.78428  ORF Transcript_35241/g.78428 Transcript_35241/m.78428 type:complete len:201 (+) Transcript_35241:3162-3764(+)